jgi:hypothetical protein
VNLSFSVKIARNLAHSFKHLFDGLAAAADRAQRVDVGTCGDGDLLASDIRLHAVSLAENPAVENQCVAAEIANSLSQVVGLRALRVQRADD